MRRPIKPFSVEVKRSRRGSAPIAVAPPPQAAAPVLPVFQAPAPVARSEGLKIQGRILEALNEPAPRLYEEPETQFVSSDLPDEVESTERVEPVRRPRGRPRKIPLAAVPASEPASAPVQAPVLVPSAPRIVVRKIRKQPVAVVIEPPAPVLVAAPQPFVLRARPEEEFKRGDKWKRRLPKILRQTAKRSVG